MSFGRWDIVFHLVLMLFWFRIWTREDRSLHFNHYLRPVGKISDTILDFLRPVIPGLGVRTLSVAAVVFLLVLRALAVPRMSPGAVGFGFTFRRPEADYLSGCLLFSAVSFGIFLFKLWGLSLLYGMPRRDGFASHTTDALYYAARPFSDLPVTWRPAVLLGYGILLTLALDIAGRPVSALAAWNKAGMVPLLLRSVVSSVAGWVNLLALLRSIMLILIIGSWVSMFAASPGVGFFCRDWIELLLGPMRRFPLRVGMIDLTPLIFFLLLGLLHGLLHRVLLLSYGSFV